MAKTFGVDPDVLKLGLVSFLTDLSSEMIFAVFAIFFTTIAGGSAALLGLVEGMADFAASSLDYIAGWLSDKTGNHKILAMAGYGFSTLSKTILLVATSVGALSAFRVIERLGKSFRGPPRDAWLALIATQSVRGYSFGVHKALDKAGAIAGPLVAYALLSRRGEMGSSLRLLFWVAFVPALLSVFVLGLIEDRKGTRYEHQRILTAWSGLSRGFKRYVVAAGIFSVAYFSFGFLLLRARTVGFSVKDTVLLYALFNVSFVVAAPLIGRLGDRIGRSPIVLLSYAIYLVMNLGFALARTKLQIATLFLMYGVFYSIDEAQSKAFIADVESERRATAIGVYNFLTGVCYLPASLIAGELWATRQNLVFIYAASVSFVAIAVFLFLLPGRQSQA
jgi:MFS family permease